MERRQHRQRAPVIGSLPDMVEAGDGFQVMADDIRARRHHRCQRATVPLKIGDQKLNTGPGETSRIAATVAVMCCSAVFGQIVPCRTGYHHMGKFETKNRLRNPCRFPRVNGERRLAGNIAEGAQPGAEPSENEERRLMLPETLGDVGTARLLQTVWSLRLPSRRSIPAWAEGCIFFCSHSGLRAIFMGSS